MRFARFVIRGGVAVLTGGLMSATVFLGPTPASADAVAKEPIQPVTGVCGTPTGSPAIGIVEFHRVKDTVDLNVHLEGGTPNTVYDVTLFPPPSRGSCTTSAGRRGPLVTDDKGIANGIFRFVLPQPKATLFLADVSPSGKGGQNETPRVTLI
jgi:hypothetical protein